jgi:hypothetical protein
MADPSTFRGTLDFLATIGVFDVVLPFLLVFTIIFALLEKTKIFGTEKHGEHEVTKKNLNSLAAFVISFFVIASAQLVEVVTQISRNVIVLVLASTFFLLLAGSFQKQSADGYFLEGTFKTFFMWIMFLGLFGIFLNAIETGGRSWLDWILGWLSQFFNNVGVASIVLMVIVVGALWLITKDSGHGGAPPNGGNHK